MSNPDQDFKTSPIALISDERYALLMKNEGVQLTEQELAGHWHFCPDWDGLLIGPSMSEIAHCNCPHVHPWYKREAMHRIEERMNAAFGEEGVNAIPF